MGLATKSPAASETDARITTMDYARRSSRFDQVLDDDYFGNDDLDDICAPIKCDEEDDGPDFSRMAKKQA